MNFPASSSARPHHDEQAVYGDEPRGRRDSNALRASVLDVAMQLGIGSSRTLQNWMFDAVDEEDEGDPDDDDLVSSGQRPQLGRFKSIYREEFDAATLSSGVLDAITKHPGGVRMPPPPIPDSPPKTQSRFRNKLRKGRKSDEMEPDTGYLSEGGAAAKRRVHKAKRAAMRSSEDQTDDEGYISEATKKKRPFFRNMFGDKQKEMPPISTPQPLAARQPPAPTARSRSPLPPPTAAPVRASTVPSSQQSRSQSRSQSPLPPPPRMSDSRASSPARSPLWLERSLTPTSATSQSFVPHNQSAQSTPPRSPLPAARSPLWLERNVSSSSISGSSTPEPRTPSMHSNTVSPSQSKQRFS